MYDLTVFLFLLLCRLFLEKTFNLSSIGIWNPLSISFHGNTIINRERLNIWNSNVRNIARFRFWTSSQGNRVHVSRETDITVSDSTFVRPSSLNMQRLRHVLGIPKSAKERDNPVVPRRRNQTVDSSRIRYPWKQPTFIGA